MNIQLQNWQGDFGNSYSTRNSFNPGLIGQRKTVFENILKVYQIKNILEVGCNVGLNLHALRLLGYPICGIEPNHFAMKEATRQGLQVISGTAYDIPYDKNTFDLVLSCGLLIHIPEKSISKAVAEMLRVSKKYFLVIEYFSEKAQEINYRGNANMLWKRNWKEIMKTYPVNLIQERHLDQGFDNCWCGLYKKTFVKP